MQKHYLVLGLLALLAMGGHAADAPVPTCEQIRAEIMAVKGLAVIVNPELLQKISLRGDCQFTSAEVYRAAYGDKPLPPPESYRSHHQHDDHDD